jgi:pimeloyl-ACP methyl ester carboxylesterase
MKSVLAALLLFTPACKAFAFLFPAPVPMQALRYPSSPSGRAECLIIFLPGQGDDADAFEKAGFIDELRSRKIRADVEAAAATYGYYAKWTFPERFGTDIVEPAVAQGYPHIWLAGVSMGGYGAADFATHHGDLFDGVFLIAPYLGEGAVLDEIRRAGGLRSWIPGEATGDRDERALWLWLRNVAAGQIERPELYLGFGDGDHMHGMHQLLASAMPEAHVYAGPGGHDWPVWRRAWASFLASSDFANRCGVTQ